MNCKNQLCRKLWYLAMCGSFLPATFSCVDDKYDLSKEISSEVTLLGDVTLPLGVSEPYYLGDMIDTSEIDMLSIINGTYAISVEDTIEVSIDAVGGEDGITISGIEEKETIEEDISENTDLPTFNIDISSSVSVNQELEQVELGEGGTIDDEIGVLPTYDQGLKDLLTADVVPSGVDITEAGESLTIVLDLDRDTISIDVDVETECPTEVVSISNIEFGDGTTGVKTTASISIGALANCFDDFAWETPKMKLTFPEEFVLEDGTNVKLVESSHCVGSTFTFDIYMSKYTAELSPDSNNENKLPNIEGVIHCEILSDVEIVGGTTNGTTLDQAANFEMIIVGEPMTIYDMDLKVSGIEVVVEKEEVGDPVDIEDVPTDIAYVEKVTFEEGDNILSITIDPVNLPDGLAPQGDGTIDVLFPTAIFDMTALTGTTLETEGEYMVLKIPQSDMIGSSSVSVKKEMLVNALTLGAEYPNVDGAVSFAPGILVDEKTITIAGTMKLADYNDYAKESSEGQTITVIAESNDLEIAVADIVTNGITVEMENKSTAIELDENIPAELVELYTMTFANEVQANISIEINGLPTGDAAGDLLFDNYTIAFPSFIKFAEGQVDDENKLVLDQIAIGSKSDEVRLFTKTLDIESLDFSDYPDLIQLATDGGDNTLLLNDSVSLTGNIKLASGEASSSLETITGLVKFTMSDIEIARITGKVDPEMPDVNESIDLSELTEDLTLEDVSAVLTNPTISMNVTNPLSIPVEIATLKLIPYKNGVAKDAIQTVQTIEIEAGDDIEGTTATTSITLSAFESSVAGHYQVVGLQNLLQELPDSIVIDVEAAVGSGEHSIDVTQDYNLTFDYAVNVPLEFDELNIAYTDTIADLNESLEDVVDMLSTIQLILEVTNTLPFALEIEEITPLDLDGKVIVLPDLLPEGNEIAAGSISSPTVSTITLHVEDNNAGDLAILDALAIKVVASITATEGGTALSEEQYLQLGVKVRLPEGFTFDYNEDL